MNIANRTKTGCDRVMISNEESTNVKTAYEEHHVIPDTIFIRDDGWTLGAPKEFEKAAYDMWKDKWVGFLTRKCPEGKPISEY